MDKIYTIGHSNHTIEKFIQLLKINKIGCVADVRSVPYSKYAVQFNKENIEKELKNNHFQYVFLGKELGARHTDPKLLFPDGTVDFEKVRETDFFKSGIERLLNGVKKGLQIAVMCVEKDPLDCHRFSLVSVGLVKAGLEVEHIMDDGSIIANFDVEKRMLKQMEDDYSQLSLFGMNKGISYGTLKKRDK